MNVDNLQKSTVYISSVNTKSNAELVSLSNCNGKSIVCITGLCEVCKNFFCHRQPENF